MRECIICRCTKDIEEFNKEHLFTETIGGAYTINTVCIVCNTQLGKDIDVPFCDHVFIGSLRKMYDLKRNGRKVKDPMKKFNRPELDYYFAMQNNQVKRHFKYKETEIKINGKTRYQTTIDEEKFTPNFVKKKKERLAKQLKVSPERIVITVDKKIEEPGTNVRFWDNNRPIELEALKIAYEFAATHIPDYINTPLAKYYRGVLRTSKVNPLFLDFFLCNECTRLNLSFNLEKLYKEVLASHFVILANIPTIGLVAVVKFFDIGLKKPMLNLIIMSVSQLKNAPPPILLINNFKKKTCELIEEGFKVEGTITFPPFRAVKEFLRFP